MPFLKKPGDKPVKISLMCRYRAGFTNKTNEMVQSKTCPCLRGKMTTTRQTNPAGEPKPRLYCKTHHPDGAFKCHMQGVPLRREERRAAAPPLDRDRTTLENPRERAPPHAQPRSLSLSLANTENTQTHLIILSSTFPPSASQVLS